MTLEEVMRIAQEQRSVLDQRIGRHRALVDQLEDFTSRAEGSENLAVVYDKACVLLNKFADERQDSVYGRLEELVTQGLTQIFQEDLRLVVRTKQVGKRADVEFKIVSKYGDYEIETDIMGARGGGVAAIAGFLMQVIVVLLTDAPKVLFLDETFAQVSAEYEPRLAEFVSELADEMGMQFVIVTHSTAFEDVSDTIYRTKAKDGVTTLERVK